MQVRPPLVAKPPPPSLGGLVAVLEASGDFDEAAPPSRAAAEHAVREAAERRAAAEERARRLADPDTVAWLREGAKAAVHWCHRSPLSAAERAARLEGKRYVEPEPDLSQFYYY